MNLARNEFERLMENTIPFRKKKGDGLTSKEISKIVNRSQPQVGQVIKKLLLTGKIFRENVVKRNLSRNVRTYFRLTDKTSKHFLSEADKRQITCKNCHWFSGIHRCILLDLAFRDAKYSLIPSMKLRVIKDCLAPDTPRCKYFLTRGSGQCKRKTINDFIKLHRDSDSFVFRCPFLRCNRIIEEFSNTLQFIKLGSTTLYCPHCSSPMKLTYDEYLDRYEVKYWNSYFDVLQQSYNQITGLKLPSRYIPDRELGVSIRKHRSFHLDLQKEILYIGNNLTPEQFELSKDLTYYPLRLLDYIATSHWEDYYYLEKKLHKCLPSSGRKLYENIELFSPRGSIESTDPLDKEIGGNEMIIATGVPFGPMLQSNFITRRTLLEHKITEYIDAELSYDFNKSLTLMEKYIKENWNIKSITNRDWQQLEGGCASLMLEPFRKEARKYDFFTPARDKSRMVKGESFLSFGYYYARSQYDSLLNGVFQVITSKLKIELYNEIPYAWNGLRGWCHRGYPFGLYLDTIEQIKILAYLWIHEAIRTEEIKPNEFEVRRGKRYEKYYCVKPETELWHKIQTIAKQVLATIITLDNGLTASSQRIYNRYLQQQKILLNKLASLSVELLDINSASGNLVTLWRKLKETMDKTFLTRREQQQMNVFTKNFFTDHPFESLTIVGIA